MKASTLSISGTLVGELWWPIGAKYSIPVSASVDRSIDDRPLYELLDGILTREGGDSSSAPSLWAGSLVTFTRRVQRGDTIVTRERFYELASFPSVAVFTTDDEPYFGDDDV